MKIGSGNIARLMTNNMAVQVVKYGLELVWQAIRSCFGNGYWISNKPWIGKDLWKTNK